MDMTHRLGWERRQLARRGYEKGGLAGIQYMTLGQAVFRGEMVRLLYEIIHV